jgi:hypothetical protein
MYFLKNLISIIFIIGIFTIGYSQKEIVRNGIKINKLDKKNKKQGSWFFFDGLGNLEVSCYYNNDSIIKPIIFYKNQDSTFIRYPKINNSELFLLKSNTKWVVGTFETIKKDSIKIEILGFYKKIGKDSLDIEENDSVSNSMEIKKEASYWIEKEVLPIYMFGTETLNEFCYRLLSSSKYIFNKKIYADLTLNESGQIEKINFPRIKNNLSFNEENELAYLFSSKMQRWQPFFSKNKTEKFHKFIELGTSLKN